MGAPIGIEPIDLILIAGGHAVATDFTIKYSRGVSIRSS